MSANDLEPVPVEGCGICHGYALLAAYWRGWGNAKRVEHANDEIRTHPHGAGGDVKAGEGPYEPETGEVVHDAARGRVGRVLGRVGAAYRICPLNGGVEWEAVAQVLSSAVQSDAMSAALAEVNAQSRGYR
ncbi:hypothetical protein ACWF94_38380 [Streptomyces sp. NPDC055078]